MAKQKPPVPTPTDPDALPPLPKVKKTRARRVSPEVIAAQEALAKAKSASAGYMKQQKLKRLISLQESLNNRLDAVEAQIQALQ